MDDAADWLSRIEEIEHVWIEMPDGCRLSARLWLPRTAREKPVPAILEYIPYRKRDFMRSRDEPIHRYFAAHGYAAVRVDLRGTGDSEGVMRDEYTPQEQADAVAAIAWIAAQPWCTGAVGMMGISWGGFNSLQVAALRPPALKAVITLCSTDDRYADDAHYMGGCLLNENMQWGSILTLYAALPPDPEIVGKDWRKMWRDRLAALGEAFPVVWMRHQRRDGYWRQGSVCEEFAAIDCPVYAIGGWADGYSNAVPRLIAGLTCPRKGLIGPWAHNFPHEGVPGPSIGFLQEAIRWWDTWLKGENTGIMDEPALRIWMQESVPPQPQYAERPGRWLGLDGWPSADVDTCRLYLNAGHLAEQAEPPTELSFSSPQTTGMRAGEWCAFGADGEMPRDQRPDDGGSLVFDSSPLPERIELLGAPVLELDVKVDRPVALLAARLGDVAPDGSVLRVTYGLLNLTHRDGHAAPTPIDPGSWHRVRLQLNDIAQAVPAGHRLRVSLSTSYWPIAWPPPEPVVLAVRAGTSALDLPLRRIGADEPPQPDFAPPASAPGTTHRKLRQIPMRRTVTIDLTTNEQVYTLKSDGGELEGASLARIEEINLDLGYTLSKRYRIIETDPLSAQTELFQSALLRRGGWSVRLVCQTRLGATSSMFLFSGDLVAYESDAEVEHKEWTIAIPRDLV